MSNQVKVNLVWDVTFSKVYTAEDGVKVIDVYWNGDEFSGTKIGELYKERHYSWDFSYKLANALCIWDGRRLSKYDDLPHETDSRKVKAFIMKRLKQKVDLEVRETLTIHLNLF